MVRIIIEVEKTLPNWREEQEFICTCNVDMVSLKEFFKFDVFPLTFSNLLDDFRITFSDFCRPEICHGVWFDYGIESA